MFLPYSNITHAGKKKKRFCKNHTNDCFVRMKTSHVVCSQYARLKPGLTEGIISQALSETGTDLSIRTRASNSDRKSVV